MSRKVVNRDLPPLREALPEFTGFVGDEDRHHRMEILLGEAAQRLRGARRRPFYSMRETAAFFGVSVRTIYRVYQRLQREGVLLCARSSMTMLPPRTAVPRVPVRGVIGLPVWYPGFWFFHEWRRFFLHLEEELRRYRFAADLIFYGQNQELEPEFADRVLARNPDYVFWFCPSPADNPTLLVLGDAGIPRVILTGCPSLIPGRYGLSMAKAVSRGLAAWKADGIRRVQVVESADRNGLLPEWLRNALGSTGLAHTVVSYANPDPVPYLHALGNDPKTGVFFTNDMVQSFLWRLAPEALVDLARRTRVMVEKTIPLLGVARGSTAPFDVIHMDWRAVAAAIARDFDRETTLLPQPSTVFEAEWRPRIDQATINVEAERL
jgi:hypothetical protein